MSKPWSFDTTARRYRSGDTGRFLPRRDVVALRDAVVNAAGAEAQAIGQRVVAGDISAEEFRDSMRLLIRNAHGAQAIFGRGGVNAMTPADFGRLGASLRKQYAYLDGFVADVEAGVISEAQAAARAQMYVNGSVKSYELGQAAAWGLQGQLPEYPGDSCLGLSNCRCSWDIRETADAIEATWKLGSEKPCPPCQRNAENWSPLMLPKWTARPDTTPVTFGGLRRVA